MISVIPNQTAKFAPVWTTILKILRFLPDSRTNKNQYLKLMSQIHRR